MKLRLRTVWWQAEPTVWDAEIYDEICNVKYASPPYKYKREKQRHKRTIEDGKLDSSAQ